MFTVELYAGIRRAVMIDGLSRREAAKRFGVHRNTITKMLQFSVPPGYRRRERPASGLAQDWGCVGQPGKFRVYFLTWGGRVAWILRLVKTGAEGDGQSTDVMEINKPDDLGDIAALGLSLAEAKL